MRVRPHGERAVGDELAFALLEGELVEARRREVVVDGLSAVEAEVGEVPEDASGDHEAGGGSVGREEGES